MMFLHLARVFAAVLLLNVWFEQTNGTPIVLVFKTVGNQEKKTKAFESTFLKNLFSEQSSMLSAALENLDDEKEDPEEFPAQLQNIEYDVQTIDEIEKYLLKAKENQDFLKTKPKLPRPLNFNDATDEVIQDWEKEYIDNLIPDGDTKDPRLLNQVLLIADFLKLSRLSDLIACKHASFIYGKTTAEITQWFNKWEWVQFRPNDVTNDVKLKRFVDPNGKVSEMEQETTDAPKPRKLIDLLQI